MLKTRSMIAAIIMAGVATNSTPGLSDGPAKVMKTVLAPVGTAPNHNHDGLTWPPQPRGITNIVVYSNRGQEITDRLLKPDRMDLLERKARTDPKINRVLGSKFTRITVIDKQDDKAKGEVITQMVFFSRDRNTTVEVEFRNEAIRAVKSIPASEYQPEILDEEIVEATQLARSHFLNQNISKVIGLKAYGILPYKPQGVGFFDTRVIYVSFHKHDDALPELVAWVDLTNQRILKAHEE